jgi:hypothetical protein
LEINNSAVWWLPEKTENKLSGNLTYQWGKEAILSLNGIFDENIDFYEIILGEIDGCKVTLANCMRVSWKKTRSGTGDSSHSVFKLIAICKGKHFLRKTDLVFNTISVRYSHIRYWLAAMVGGTEKERACLKEGDPYLKQATEKSLIMDFSPEISIEIKGFLEREKCVYYNPYNQETDVLFHLKSQKLSEVIKVVDIFRNFLAICIDEKISIVSMEAQERKGPVQLILPSILKPVNGNDSKFLIPEPIERYLFVKNAKLFMGNWYLFAEKYEPVYQLFFSDNFEKLYVTTRFLGFCHAIEAYYSRKYETRFFADDALRKMISELEVSENIKAVPSEYKVAFLKRLEYENRKSLRMILKDLFKEYVTIFPIFIRKKSDFIERFVTIRNYFTHYDPSTPKPSPKEIIVLTENARFILLSVFFREIGLEEKDIKSAICRYTRGRIRELKSL